MARLHRNRRKKRSAARRLAEFTGTFVLFFGVAIAAAILDERSMQDLSGMPRTADGDTLVFDGRRVRLAGIDAPELHQTCRRSGADYPCGRQARLFLAGLLEDGETECMGNEEDRYGRLLVRCICANTDVNAAMVRAGWAVAYGGYDGEEAAAKREEAGIWSGSFVQPDAWRASRGGLAELGPAGMTDRLLNRMKDILGSRTGKDNP